MECAGERVSGFMSPWTRYNILFRTPVFPRNLLHWYRRPDSWQPRKCTKDTKTKHEHKTKARDACTPPRIN